MGLAGMGMIAGGNRNAKGGTQQNVPRNAVTSPPKQNTPLGNGARNIDPNTIKFSQSSVNGVGTITTIANVPEKREWQFFKFSGFRLNLKMKAITFLKCACYSMKKKGWVGDPIDVVQMPDGSLVTLDNTRVAAARQAGINVRATVRQYNDPLPNNMV